MSCVTVFSLESLFVRSARGGFPRVTVLSLESLFVRSSRLSACCVTVLSLDSLVVRSNRISMCCITLLCLESLFVRSNRIIACRVTVLSLESLFVRSNRISACRVTVLSLELRIFHFSELPDIVHLEFVCYNLTQAIFFLQFMQFALFASNTLFYTTYKTTIYRYKKPLTPQPLHGCCVV